MFLTFVFICLLWNSSAKRSAKKKLIGIFFSLLLLLLYWQSTTDRRARCVQNCTDWVVKNDLIMCEVNKHISFFYVWKKKMERKKEEINSWMSQTRCSLSSWTISTQEMYVIHDKIMTIYDIIWQFLMNVPVRSDGSTLKHCGMPWNEEMSGIVDIIAKQFWWMSTHNFDWNQSAGIHISVTIAAKRMIKSKN